MIKEQLYNIILYYLAIFVTILQDGIENAPKEHQRPYR